MPKLPDSLPPQDPALAPPVDLDDPVEVASVDRFPASDPPGWIDARPKLKAKSVQPDRQ